MSNTTPTPDFPPPPESAPKKSRTNLIIIGSAAAVIAAVIGTGIAVVSSQEGGSQDSKPADASSSAAVTTADDPDPTPSYVDVDTDSFTIKLKTTKKQCFGSAGCNVTVEPDLTLMVDSESVDPDATYEITYEIHGDDSGPVIETAELSNQTSLNYTPSSISTASAGTKVSVEITGVIRSGA